MTIPLFATSTNLDATFRDAWTKLSPTHRLYLLSRLQQNELEYIAHSWQIFAHAHQRPPARAQGGSDWTTWLLIGGRGAGKTRTGAEWVRGLVAGAAPVSPIALIGETEHDVREVMIEGTSGILASYGRGERPTWTSSRRRLQWRNGAIAYAYSAEDPDSLRGPQFAAAWGDELAKWRHAEATFDMLQFGLRLGERPRQVITTTPRPISLLKRLLKDPNAAVTRAATIANACNLAPAFLESVVGRYAGTRLGRQELDGELIEERPDALWSRGLIESCRVEVAPELQRIVVAVDPPASAGADAAACGLVAVGRAENGVLFVVADETVAGMSPAGWATKAIGLWRRLAADALVAEINQGGDMVRSVLAQVDATVPIIGVRAYRGKYLRAEPVAALYEQSRIKHVGVFPALEDEMCDFGLDGLSSGRSPDRLDALVWAVTALSFGAKGEPRVRGL